MILVIRISGQVNLPEKVKETLSRLRLRKKYTAILLKPSTENQKLLKRIRNYIAYGDINPATLKELIKSRAVPQNKETEISPSQLIEDLEKKSLSQLKIKPFFRLHPPRGGIDAKKHFGVSPKAVLGDNKEKINDLVRRML
jgi:large subunit ribosomal protein L30